MQDLESKQFLEGGALQGKKKKKPTKHDKMNLEETCVRTALLLGF